VTWGHGTSIGDSGSKGPAKAAEALRKQWKEGLETGEGGTFGKREETSVEAKNGVKLTHTKEKKKRVPSHTL
jgi:hypothetical protein